MNGLLSPETQLAQLRRNTATIISEAELLAKLREGRPLRVKQGFDPTAPDIHLGHTVGLQKMRQFQDLGHEGIIIIGDFTATIGDPSGRSATRPQLSREAVLTNAETYQRQAFKVLDPARTRVVFNGEWFGTMTYEQVLRLNSRVTLQQMLQREDFRARWDGGTPISLHELQYPILQGWDSVMIQADVELGGTDQLFNILVGRDLQKEEGQPPQIVMTLPILEGLDGVQKMSKSLGNYIGVTEAPTEMFGKTMSVSDELMARYYPVLLGEEFPADAHPMDAKKNLATRLVARFHSEAEAQAAQTAFEKRGSEDADLPIITVQKVKDNLLFGVSQSRGREETDLPRVILPETHDDILSVVGWIYVGVFKLVKSRSDLRRLIEGGSVQWRGKKMLDAKARPDFAVGGVLKLDKIRSVRIAPLA